MTKKNDRAAVERKLSHEIISALESSSEIADSVKRGVLLTEKRTRLKNELLTMQDKKADLQKKVEVLKENFGSKDSLSDLSKLTSLSLELDSLDTAIPLLKTTLGPESEIVRSIEESKQLVGENVYVTMAEIQKRLQTDFDEKTEALISSYTAYMKGFERAAVAQEVIPREFLPKQFRTAFLPNSEKLENVASGSLPGSCLQDTIRRQIFREMQIKMSQEATENERIEAPAPEPTTTVRFSDSRNNRAARIDELKGESQKQEILTERVI